MDTGQITGLLNIYLCNFTKGKGIWKFNCSLLKELEYLKMINKTDIEKKVYSVPVYNIENLDGIPDQNIQLTIYDRQFLEVLLLHLRGETIKFASGLK